MASKKRRGNRRRNKNQDKASGPLAPLQKLLGSAGIDMVRGALLVTSRELAASSLPDSEKRATAVTKSLLELFDASEECSRKIRHAWLKFPGSALYLRAHGPHVVAIEISGEGEVDLPALGMAAQEFLSGLQDPAPQAAAPVKRKIGGARVALSPDAIAALTGRGAFPGGAPADGLALSS